MFTISFANGHDAQFEQSSVCAIFQLVRNFAEDFPQESLMPLKEVSLEAFQELLTVY